LSANTDLLVCPETRLPLRECPLAEAESAVAGGAPLATRADSAVRPIGPTPTVMLRADTRCAYPVVDGLPLLLAPEMLMPPDSVRAFDLSAPRYAEAYEEMDYYSSVGRREAMIVEESALASADARRTTFRELARSLEAPDSARASFPHPRTIWIDARFDAAAQWDAYRHLAPVQGKRVVQLGGDGRHAVKFLAAGAAEAWALSPMLGELEFARSLARSAGFAERLNCVAGLAEELPFRDSSFDVIYAGGSVHHMVTESALPECARILRPGGKFASIEPWRAPLYGIGTRVFGKREPSIHCRPMTAARALPMFTAFEQAHVIHHGSITRYPLIALERLGHSVKISTAWNINRIDDFLCSLFPPLRRIGSSVALLGAMQGGTVKTNGVAARLDDPVAIEPEVRS
jgi:SAM-dependent methyltransferase/uncharacterized protein YbaR (Trm112 family)